MKIAVVSPHRDDAAFSLGLSADGWLAAKHTVHVLNCFTNSVYAPYSDADSLHPNDRASFVSATRKREDLAWNKLTGNKLHITNLDMLEAPLRLPCTVAEVVTRDMRPGDRAVARIAGAVAKLARNGFAIALPLAVGAHIDHRVAREAGLQALKEASFALAFYEDLPYVSRPGAEEQIEALVTASEVEVQPMLCSGTSDNVMMQIARKRKIVECYNSQIDSEVAGQIAQFCERYGGRERIWVNEAWRALLEDPQR